MGERKVRKPRVVRMWAARWEDEMPWDSDTFAWTKNAAVLKRDDVLGVGHVGWRPPVVRVEVREVPKKKGKGNRRA